MDHQHHADVRYHARRDDGSSGGAMGMMEMMKNVPPAEHQKMMADMMGMMQGIMGQMGGTSQGNQAQMMPQIMSMMSQMVEMMKGMSADAQGQMMPQMMSMMGQMMQMMGGSTGDAGSMGGMSGAHVEPIPSAGVPDATARIGGQPLAFKVENGAKVFELTASPVRWNILDNVKVTAWAYNGSVRPHDSGDRRRRGADHP
jgi:hypothetical protein